MDTSVSCFTPIPYVVSVFCVSLIAELQVFKFQRTELLDHAEDRGVLCSVPVVTLRPKRICILGGVRFALEKGGISYINPFMYVIFCKRGYVPRCTHVRLMYCLSFCKKRILSFLETVIVTFYS